MKLPTRRFLDLIALVNCSQLLDILWTQLWCASNDLLHIWILGLDGNSAWFSKCIACIVHDTLVVILSNLLSILFRDVKVKLLLLTFEVVGLDGHKFVSIKATLFVLESQLNEERHD